MGFVDRARLALQVLTAPSADLRELGRPGTKHWAGRISTDEYVPELQGMRALDLFEKMRRSDGAIAATLRSLKLPLRSATWDVEAPERPTPVEQEATDRFRNNLFETMSMTFEDHLRQLLTHLDFGHYVCEKVWQIADASASISTLEFRRGRGDILDFSADPEQPDHYRWNGSAASVDRKTFYMALGRFSREPMVTLRKLAPRMQRTIERWDIQPDGGLTGIKQRVYGDEGGSELVTIPVEKLLIFTNEKEGANWLGKSVLRPAYKHWFMKDQLYRIQAISAERFGVGIPVMAVPADKSNDEQAIDRAESILEGIRSHEKANVVELFGYAFRIEGMKVAPPDLLPTIQHHDWMIAVSVLAQHLMVGSADTASHAMVGDITSLFLMVEEAIGKEICAIHNRYLVPQWVRFNYPNVTRFPKLTVGRIETRDTGKFLGAVGNAVQSGALTHDLELENILRGRLGVPALSSLPEPKPQPAPAPTPSSQKEEVIAQPQAA